MEPLLSTAYQTKNDQNHSIFKITNRLLLKSIFYQRHLNKDSAEIDLNTLVNFSDTLMPITKIIK